MPALENDPRHGRLRSLLAEARTGKGLSQVTLAERLGKTQIWVSRYERGARQISVIEFIDIAQAIGVDPCRLLRKLTNSVNG